MGLDGLSWTERLGDSGRKEFWILGLATLPHLPTVAGAISKRGNTCPPSSQIVCHLKPEGDGWCAAR